MNLFKTIFSIFSFTLVSSLALPSFAFDPATYCDDNSACTGKMHEISQAFKSATLAFAKNPSSAYSGACVHLNDKYDAEKIHHGAFAFEAVSKDLMTWGVFSFFWPENPYSGMKASELLEQLKKSHSPSPTQLDQQSLLLAYVFPESTIRYWFRSTADSSRLYVIGLEAQGFTSNLVFCELAAHSN